MNSHELAHYLLKRRANDVRIEVLRDDDPEGERGYYPQRTDLRDQTVNSGACSFTIPSEEVVVYDPENDVIVIRAAVIVTGEADE